LNGLVLFSNVSIIPNFVSVMSKTVKPSWSFPVISAEKADITPAMEKSLSHLELNL